MISVVVPVYNTGKYLERCIQALLSQDYPKSDYELIFVDNGSTDDSVAILGAYPEIQTLSEKTPGSYAARNRGIRQAQGDILAFTDSDCYPVTGWLRSIDDFFRGTQTEVVFGPRIPTRPSRSINLIANYENHKAQLVYASSDPLVYFGYTNNMAVRLGTMQRFGPFVQRMRGSDTIFVRRVVEGSSCAVVSYCPEMAVQHAELESLAAYYEKVATYGRSRRAYRHITKVRPLTQRERLRAFWMASRGSPLVDSVHLFALLAAGAVAWWVGSLQLSTTNR